MDYSINYLFLKKAINGGRMFYNVESNRFSFISQNTKIEKLWWFFLIQRKIDSFKKAIQPIKYLFIEPYRTCNLKCSYCYAKNPGNGQVDINILKNLLKNNKFEEVLVFGGEPFLTKEKGLLPEITKLIEGRLAISTNGINVDEEILTKLHKNLSLQVSIEPREWGNRVSKFGKHQNELLGKDKFKNTYIYFRITIPKEAVYVPLKQVIEQIAQIKGNYNFSITYWAENGNQLNSDLIHKWIKDSLILFHEDNKYKNKLIWEWWTGRLFSMFTNKKYFEYTNCNAAIESISIAPDSKLYGCHEMAVIENDKHKINVVEDRLKLVKIYIDSFCLPECASCKIRYFCGGVCFVHQHRGSCEFLRKTFDAFLGVMDWYFNRNLLAFYEHSKSLDKRKINRANIDKLISFANGQLSLEEDINIITEEIDAEYSHLGNY